MLADFLRRVRSRPVNERRFLAASTYLALTAIIGALWIHSLGNSIALESFGNFSPVSAPGSSDTATTAQADHISSPFQALAQSLKEISIGIRDMKQAWSEGGKAGPPPPDVPPTLDQEPARDAMAFDHTAVMPLAPPGTLRTPKLPRPQARAGHDQPPKISTFVSGLEHPALHDDLADLLLPAEEAVRGTTAVETPHGLLDIIGSGASAITQTFINAYHGIFE